MFEDHLGRLEFRTALNAEQSIHRVVSGKSDDELNSMDSSMATH